MHLPFVFVFFFFFENDGCLYATNSEPHVSKKFHTRFTMRNQRVCSCRLPTVTTLCHSAYFGNHPLVTTRPIPYVHQTSSVLRRSALKLLSVTWNNLLHLQLRYLPMHPIQNCLQQTF